MPNDPTSAPIDLAAILNALELLTQKVGDAQARAERAEGLVADVARANAEIDPDAQQIQTKQIRERLNEIQQERIAAGDPPLGILGQSRAKRDIERQLKGSSRPSIFPGARGMVEPPRIRQGVKASVETVPMPVRLEVNQTRLLKLLATLSGNTASGIIRDCVDAYLADRLAHDIAFKQAAMNANLL